jgi:antitoxin (DNA-binding transcriptional repressor) of toxin-antitoxin stability system
VRGESLREKAAAGKPLAITNRGGLIGVVIPVAPAWLEHLIDYNLSHVEQSIAEAERAIADKPMVTLHDVVEQLRAALNPRPAGEPNASEKPTALTVRIGDLTAKLIEQAGVSGQTIALTHERQLIAIVIPVTRDLVEFLLEQNMSRVLYNLGLAEKQIGAAGTMTSLDQLSRGRKSA